MFDLEIWLIGTPTDVAAALAALSGAGRITGASRPEPLYGADTGRIRRYLRLSVPTPTPTPKPTRTAGTNGQSVIGLDTYRRTA
jgi:hypothetical protein